MGYLLFNERMMETYLHARKFLKPGGRYPNVAAINFLHETIEQYPGLLMLSYLWSVPMFLVDCFNQICHERISFVQCIITPSILQPLFHIYNDWAFSTALVFNY